MREVLPGDGEGCARAWRDAGRYYAALVPDVIQEPSPEGLAEWFEGLIREERGDDSLWLVAVDGDRLVGTISAEVARPDPDARWQIQRDLSRARLVINALAVVEERRRGGVGTALMNAAEEWGRSRGAVVAVTDTNLHSPSSVPFYESLDYDRNAVIFRKSLS